MKKNKAMRLGSAVLVLALLTSCAICSTFAKYTTTAGGTDSARVAYWGFKTTTTTLDLFDATYDAVASSGKTGSATTADNVVAPGTSKTADISFQFDSETSPSITTPEVDYTFAADVSATGITGTGDADTDALDANDNFVWTLKGPNDEKATEYKTFALFSAALKSAIAGDSSGTKDYTAGNLPSTLNAGTATTYTVGWEWKYEKTTTDTSGTTTVDATQDATDTDMGNDTDLNDLAITIKITATQKD